MMKEIEEFGRLDDEWLMRLATFHGWKKCYYEGHVLYAERHADEAVKFPVSNSEVVAWKKFRQPLVLARIMKELICKVLDCRVMGQKWNAKAYNSIYEANRMGLEELEEEE